MCLNIDNTKTCPKQVFHRWKILTIDPQNGNISSPCHDYIWKRPGLNFPHKSRVKNDPQSGFHVYTSKRDAQSAIKHWGIYYFYSPLGGHKTKLNFVLAKLKVFDFKASGKIERCDDYSDGRPGEIWRSAEIIDIIPFPIPTAEDIALSGF